MFKIFKKSNDSGLLVVVQNGEYRCYGEPTPRNQFLMELLKRQGGINHTVTDGCYRYNAKRRGLNWIVTLHPAE